MFLIATAGHIDHGKTALIRALTGTETDRLPQEKARGISIDLGFAYWTDVAGTVGFVDVPGHERFIPTMLSGAGAADFALLIVAADDGIMPQTLEHLDILDLLGIRQGVVALTKSDLANPERIALLDREITRTLAGTALAGSPILPVSAATGAGIDALARLLRQAATRPRPDREAGLGFRLAIDKAFTVPGAGTVVSGAIRDGAVAVGDELTLAPSGETVRVRGLQAAGRQVPRAVAGDRCAINLRGVALDQVRRGDWLLAPGHLCASHRLTVDLRISDAVANGIRHNSQMHLHIGTTDMPCRVLLHGRSTLPVGESGVAHLVTARPVCAVAGDAFVLRDAAARQTLAGGRVVDPLAPHRRRRDDDPEPLWAALRRPDPGAGFRDFLARPGTEVDAGAFAWRRNLAQPRIETLLSDAHVVRCGPGGRLALSVRTAEQAEAAMIAGLDSFHAAQPALAGRPVAAVLADLPFRLSREVRRTILQRLREQGRLAVRGNFVHRPDHAPPVPPGSEAQWQRILAAAAVLGRSSFGLRELADASRIPEATIAEQLFEHRGRMEIWRISATRHMLDSALREIAANASALSGQSKAGFDVARLRDRTGLGRNLLIEVLEFFDRTGIALRRGDRRRIVADLDAAFQRAALAEAGLPRKLFFERPRSRRKRPGGHASR
ncbi:selenocysteine-specific translation elongation factor [Paracoccus sp. MA]|uniref:selenocysteine-specific translation elongation factor n=1 Tax=Paracoccus sp. MA TaxID=2895796 RepID=UPI001E4FD6B7|nr:selenocysteine-specific translation elongation factor [Paracoccus sp. MA]UFM64072.1 selenocysteine-specific translation elongation factor [Paracoccus sp. MA]